MFAESLWEGLRMATEQIEGMAFARAVLRAFRSAGHATDVEVGEAGGPSTTTMTALRKAARGQYPLAQPKNPTWRKIDQAAGWEEGTARRLWDSPSDPPPSSAAPLPPRSLDDELTYGDPEEWMPLVRMSRTVTLASIEQLLEGRVSDAVSGLRSVEFVLGILANQFPEPEVPPIVVVQPDDGSLPLAEQVELNRQRREQRVRQIKTRIGETARQEAATTDPYAGRPLPEDLAAATGDRERPFESQEQGGEGEA